MIYISQIDWKQWLDRWDNQQTYYIPNREQRFNLMFDILEKQNSDSFIIIDLACGPGSISQRVLNRFPKASSIAVDLDPILLKLGQEALGTFNGRLKWVEADLNNQNWIDNLPVRKVDGILSTTALHWLPTDRLIQLYKQLSNLIKPGGIFLNGDRIKFNRKLPIIQNISESIKETRKTESNKNNPESWDEWWQALQKVPELKELFRKRESVFQWRENKWTDPMIDFQIATLEEVGFQEVATIWQDLDSRILIAIR